MRFKAMRLPQLAPVWALGLTRRRLAALELVRAVVLAALAGMAAAIGPASAPRAVVVPAVGDNPMAYYLPGTDRLSRPTASVAEIDVLAFAAAPRDRARLVPAGFAEAARRRVGAFTVVRYTAARPSTLTRPQLARARLGVGHAAVLEQRP